MDLTRIHDRLLATKRAVDRALAVATRRGFKPGRRLNATDAYVAHARADQLTTCAVRLAYVFGDRQNTEQRKYIAEATHTLTPDIEISAAFGSGLITIVPRTPTACSWLIDHGVDANHVGRPVYCDYRCGYDIVDGAVQAGLVVAS